MALVKLTVKTWHSLSTSSYLFFPPIYKDFSQIMLCLITSIALCIPELFETLKCFFSLDHSDFGFLCLTYHKVSNYVFVFFPHCKRKHIQKFITCAHKISMYICIDLWRCIRLLKALDTFQLRTSNFCHELGLKCTTVQCLVYRKLSKQHLKNIILFTLLKR